MKRLEKKIVLGNGKYVYATVEEAVFNHADKAIKAFAKRCENSLAWTQNGYDLEDYIQVGRMEVIKMFDVYDEVHTFSSMFNTRLDQLYIYLLRYYGNQKRSMEDRDIEKNGEKRVSYKPLSLQSMYDEDKEYSEVIGFLHDDMINVDYKYAIESCLHNMDETDKQILAFLIEESEAKFDFAKRIGMSRPTLDKKIKQIRQILKSKLEIA